MTGHVKEAIAISCLQEIKEVFDKHGIKYWLDWGTLLGAVRDGKIIPWDHDVDLGATEDEWDKIAAAVPELEIRGFSVKATYLKMYNHFFNKSIYMHYLPGCPTGLTVYHIDKKDASLIIAADTNLVSQYLRFVHTLLYFPKVLVQRTLINPRPLLARIHMYLVPMLPKWLKNPLASIAWWLCRKSGLKFTHAVIPRHHFEKLDNIEFYGMSFNIPSSVDDYLKLHYGEDWRTPRKDWALQDDGVFESSD